MNGSPLVTVFFIYGDCLIKKTVQAQICGSMDWIARSRVGLQLQPELDPRHKFFFTKRGEVFVFFISFTLVSIVTSVIVAGAVSILFLLWSSFFFISSFYFVSSSSRGGPRMFYPFWIRSNAPSVRVPESSGDWGAGFLFLCSNGRRGKESVDRSVTTKWTLSDSGSN